MCRYGDDLLVSYLSAGPFPPGEARIVLVSPSGEVSPFINDLTGAADVICSSTATGPRIFTLEATLSTGSPAPSGRLRVYEDPVGRTLATGLVFPTGMALDPQTGDMYVAEPFAGQIRRVPVR